MSEFYCIERLKTMKRQEKRSYAHHNFLQTKRVSGPSLLVDGIVWREKICAWTYSVVDHFVLTRSTVAVSMNLYDRYMGACGSNSKGSVALLCSLSTLFIAVKLHEPKSSLDRFNLAELCKLCRGKYQPKDIEEMELKILQTLSWLVNPPLATDFVSLLLNLLPPAVHPFVSQRMFEMSQYIVELTVCDPFFIGSPPSMIAFASILNVLEKDIDLLSFSSTNRTIFLKEMTNVLSLDRGDNEVRRHRKRMQNILSLQDDSIEDVKVPKSPSSVRDIDDELNESNYNCLEQCLNLKGHKRNPSADSVNFSKSSKVNGRHRRSSSANSLDFQRMPLACDISHFCSGHARI